MQIFSCLVTFTLAGIALGVPTKSPLSPGDVNLEAPSLMVRQTDSPTVRTTEVITKMEDDLGKLNWTATAGNGQLLTVPIAEWEKYVDEVKTEHERGQNQARALQKRGTRYNFNGQWAEYTCYQTGYDADYRYLTRIERIDGYITSACQSFYYSVGSSPIQVWAGPWSSGIEGIGERWVFKFENWGKLSYAWSSALCYQVIWATLGSCDPGSGYHKGAWTDIYTAPQQNTQTRGSKALAFTADPTHSDE